LWTFKDETETHVEDVFFFFFFVVVTTAVSPVGGGPDATGLVKEAEAVRGAERFWFGGVMEESS
jgi:hypothetical protein